MAFPDDQVAELKHICDGVQESTEAGRTYFLLLKLRLPEGCNPSPLDALFCPTPRDGYPSRLFFAERVRSAAQLNWNANRVRILDRNWDAFSWKVNAIGRLIQMLAAHLRGFQ